MIKFMVHFLVVASVMSLGTAALAQSENSNQGPNKPHCANSAANDEDNQLTSNTNPEPEDTRTRGKKQTPTKGDR